jgi:hypothetical protein
MSDSSSIAEVLKSIGGTGAVLVIVLYGVYMVLKPLVENHVALINEVRADLKSDRVEFNQHRLESQRVQIEMLQALRDLRESIVGQGVSNERSETTSVPALRELAHSSGVRERRA